LNIGAGAAIANDQLVQSSQQTGQQGLNLGGLPANSSAAHIARVMATTVPTPVAVAAAGAADTVMAILSAGNEGHTSNEWAALTSGLVVANGQALTPHTQAMAAIANQYLQVAGHAPLAHLPSLSPALTPASVIGQQPIFAGLSRADNFGPVFERAQALQGVASNPTEWQQIGQGVQSVSRVFGEPHAALVHEGINRMAPVFGAMAREAGGYSALVSNMQAAGVSVQAADHVFAGLVAGYLQERGVEMSAVQSGSGTVISVIPAAVIQQVAPHMHHMTSAALPASEAPSVGAASASLVQYGQAFALPMARTEPITNAIGAAPTTGMALPTTSHTLVPQLTHEAVAQVPGFANLPAVESLAVEIQTRAASLAAQTSESGDAAVDPIQHQMRHQPEPPIQSAASPARQLSGQGLYGRAAPAPAQPVSATSRGEAAATAPDVSSSQSIPGGYVQAVLQGYGPDAQLSSAPNLILNPGIPAGEVARVTPAHINIAAYIGDRVGAGATQIPHLARTVSDLSREVFGTGLVGDVIRKAEALGVQPISPMERYSRFGEYLDRVIQQHLSDHAAIRSDDPQLRKASRNNNQPKRSPKGK
jgi:hypothetical protein